jgi:protein ImuB
VPFACLFVPDFSVQAVVRLETDLLNKPVAVFAGAPPLSRVFAANSAAWQLGAEIGLTKLQAEAFSGIVWRWRSPSQEATAFAALLDCAWTISPRVENWDNTGEGDLPDTVVLDLAGCEKLFGTSEKIARDLKRAASKVGFDANVAVAGNPAAAVSAARGFPGITVIPPGGEGAQIGKLPLSALRISPELFLTLNRWGIRTCAEFANLPEIAVVERFGQEGRRWQLLAQGADSKPLIAKEFPDRFEECMELETPVDLLEPLLFVLNRLLDQLCVRLRMHLLAASEIKVTLALQRKGPRDEKPLVHIRTIRLPVPAKESKFLLKLLQLNLEAHPPASPVSAVSILAVPATSRSRQLGLFLPLSPEPQRLEITLARIQSAVGESRVGSPMLLDSHRPNAFEQNHFVLTETAPKHPAKDRQAASALRIYRPPLPATVELQNHGPVSLACDGVRRQILASAGPWRSKGDWWSENAWARDEWDIQIRPLHPKHPEDPREFSEETTVLYRIYKDLRSKRWFVEGIYD